MNNEKKEDKMTNEANSRKVKSEYECGKYCRICPYPGLKCCVDPAENHFQHTTQ